MTVLDRSELEASPLADLHVIAGELGLEGFRRMRKADLIDAILGERKDEGEDEPSTPSRRRGGAKRARSRRGTAARAAREEVEEPEEDGEPASTSEDREQDPAPAPRRARRERGTATDPERAAEGVVEVLSNGSAFLRVQPEESSDGDVYISAAQVRRCELVSGDRVSGPVRAPRRSERHPSLIRVETINDRPVDAVVEGTRYEDLPVSHPDARFAFDSEDATLKAIEWLTPLGRGSRAAIVGDARGGKTETLRRIAAALTDAEGLELTLVLVGVRPEELSDWQRVQISPAAALGLAASVDAQTRAVEAAIDTAKRIAARGGDAVVLIDTLDVLAPHVARKALAAARNLTEGGSLTVIATASRPLGGESTVIALDALRAGTGRFPAIDLVRSGTLKPELLVGEEGAHAIEQERERATGR